ncbi:flagellar basal-body MS-ring/collar protein FliF [Treponema sp.]|uniref:flagellar basal-body MS-ring/collar protein FliF n=1 Tax=Treponema sp. TaxID=166 RepID=UPI00298E6403|nr:flagellar basal-body MS-ring/collar protein FliF [Treponema sp.]MCR5612557.1 flagellar M-ring protein FliF [Treponema sp.]
MNEWFKKLVSNIKEKWAKWSILQKGILVGVVIAVIIAIVLGFRFSAKPTTVKLYNAPVTGDAQAQILTRLDKDNVKADVDSAGYIRVADEQTARRYRDILISEGLTPSNIDPFAGYFDRGWSTTDADQNVKRKLAIKKALELHLESLEDIVNADVQLDLPEDKLFKSQQDPISASVVLSFAPMSDMPTNKRKIKGLEKIILTAVSGLQKENLTIADSDGTVLNDDEGLEELERLSRIEKEQKFIQKQEVYYRAQVLKTLQSIKGADRIPEINIKIDMNMSEKKIESVKYNPFVLKPNDPDTPYDESELKDSVVISSQTVTREWQGTGFNPMGPTGTEGNNPPVASDMSNVIGKQTETGVTQNSVINTDNITEIVHPTIDRVSVAVNVDGTWLKEYDKNHNLVFDEHGSIKRTYIPVPQEELEQIADLVQGAVGYDKAKNYLVVVRNVQINRQKEFEAEDEAIKKARQTRTTIILVLIGFAAVLLVFILYRFISRELERRRRIKAEEERRRQEMARIMALQEAQNEGMEVTMSVEERRRAELQENAIAMAKEHPEDVAMLIRTWLMEE